MMFVKIYNKLTNINDNDSLSPDELFVYAVVSMEKNSEGIFYTSYDVLKHMVRLGRNKKITSNKREVIKCIHNLSNKGAISLSEVNKNLIKIKINELDGGYEKLYFKELYMMRNSNDLAIYMAIKKWKGQKNGAIYSYEQWSNILHVSRVSAIKHIETAIKDELITKVGTAYSSENGANNYLINKDRRLVGIHCKL